MVLLAACAEKNSDQVAGDLSDKETVTPNEDSTSVKVENVSSDKGKAEDAILELGESGIMSNPVGKYEITVKSVRTLDKLGEFDPLMDLFFVFTVSIKNIGDKAILGEEVAVSDLFRDETSRQGSFLHEDIDNFKGEIAPGETVEGEIVFNQAISEDYSLVFGSSLITSNKLTWNFDYEEISK